MKKEVVFISYSSKEMEKATKVCKFLENNGISCWIAPRNVNPGQNYAPQIVTAIKNCGALVLLASRNTNQSAHVSNEVSLAFDNKKSIIPFKIEDFEFTDEYLYFLGRKHWIEAHTDINLGLEKLLYTLNTIVNKADSSKERMWKSSEKEGINGEKNSISEEKITYTREGIVDLLISKIEKYPYSLEKKLVGKENYENFEKLALSLFKETVSLYKRREKQIIDEQFFSRFVEILSMGTGNCIQVQGLPGCAKNMLLQLIYFKMLDRFKHQDSDYLPIYISSSYYEKIPYDQRNVYEQMKSVIGNELSEYFEYVNSNSEVKPVLFMEAIREHMVAKIAPENVVFDLWRPYGKYNRIVAVDVGLIKNRSRIKRVIPILGDNRGYTCIMNSVPITDRQASMRLIQVVLDMYDYSLDANSVYDTMRRMGMSVLDVFQIRLVVTEILSSYDIAEIVLSDMYEKMALSELYGDEDRLYSVAKELFEYVFDENYRINVNDYDGALWSMPHKHNTYLEFSIAYYFMNKIRNYREGTDYTFFRTNLTSAANKFMVCYLQDDYLLQETLLDFITENYEKFDVRQKSNAAYWLGRITYKNLAGLAVQLLKKEFTKLKSVVENNNCNTQENYEKHILFRSAYMGLLFHRQTNIMDEYLSVVVTNDVANAINRGNDIEFFGDNYQIAMHDSYYLDDDFSIGEQAIRILSSRIEEVLNGRTGAFVEHNLVSLLTMLQARMQAPVGSVKFDIRPYVKNAVKYLKIYQTRPKNVVSNKLLYYFKGTQEDMERYLEQGEFDIAQTMYNKYSELKNVKRFQWTAYEIDDPESVAEHIYTTWIMAMFFLPENLKEEGYDKRKVLDMLLIHDMAEAEVGDQITSLWEPTKDLKTQNDVLRKLFLKGTYPKISNMTYYYDIWSEYYSGISFNARLARDINLVQSVYTFCRYYKQYPEKFTDREVQDWIEDEMNLKTEIGYKMFEELIRKNKEISFKCIL
ncbi:MAG: HD domain-containing protein [Schaedlerella sp.]|nr:HD domain-containing protein [Schaedlerella sp.]